MGGANCLLCPGYPMGKDRPWLLTLIGPIRRYCTRTKVELKSTHYSSVSCWFSISIAVVLNLEDLALSEK
jgi:hypothetical protein